MAVAAEAGAAALPVEPSLDEVRELAREHNLVPLRHTFIDDCETPVSAFLKLRGARPEHPGVPARVRRAGPARRALLVHRRAPAQGRCAGRWATTATRTRSPREEVAAPPPGAAARPAAVRRRRGRLLRLRPRAHRRAARASPNPDPVGLPDMALMLSDVLVVFDHLKHTITILVNVYADDDGRSRPPTPTRVATIAKARRPARRARCPTGRARRPRARGPTLRVEHAARGSSRAMVARIVEYVHAGDAFQVVPVAALERRARRRPVLDLPRPARRQPEPVHVLPGLPGLPGRGRQPRAAADRHRAPRLDAADRRHAPARRRRRRGRA